MHGTGPVEEIDAEAIEAGLNELEEQGLAERRDLGWILREAGSEQT
jgi:hypothetical protein